MFEHESQAKKLEDSGLNSTDTILNLTINNSLYMSRTKYKYQIIYVLFKIYSVVSIMNIISSSIIVNHFMGIRTLKTK